LSRGIINGEDEMEKLEKVGERIQYVRTKKGLTLDQLAEKAGLSKSFLWEVEHDRSGISGERLLRVANALGASLEFLLRGQPAPENFEPPASIEIPMELSEMAEENGLSYKQTLTLAEIERSVLARRSTKSINRKSKEDWRRLYEGVKEFLEGT
jgi:transcriptional regulator with XRE-family HTH domain